jgi:hypothetical protein
MRLICAVLLFALLPALACPQEESLGDVARRERASKQAQQAAPPAAPPADLDKDGFLWVRQGDRSADYGVLTFKETSMTAERCRASCLKSAGCKAYKFARDKDTFGCATKSGEPIASTGGFGEAMALMVRLTIIDRAFLRATLQLPAELAKFSKTEQRGVGEVMMLAAVEENCKRITGRFATLHELTTVPCKNRNETVGPLEFHEGFDPDHDVNYALLISLNGDGGSISLQPKKPALAGFYYDGANLRSQPGGAASAASPSLGAVDEILASIAKAQPAQKN